MLLIAAAAGMWANGRPKARRAALAQMAQVETVQVKKQNLIDSISLTGTVQSADAEDSYERAVKKQEDAKRDLQEVVGDENLEPNAIKAYESTVETVEDTVKNNERNIASA